MKTCISFILILASLLSGSNIFAQEPATSACIGQAYTIESTVLQEKRTINIYLPSHFDPGQPGDVFYLLDGALEEDFVHIAGLFSFYDMMYVMPNYIVVGIANTDRRRDFTYPTTIAKDKEQFPTTGGSATFIRFLQDELKPWVEKQFKTTSNAYLIGQSLGGLVASEILIHHPHLFTHYFIVSPSLWWDNESLLQQLHTSDDYHNYKQVYIAVGEFEEKRMRKDAKSLYRLLKKLRNDKKTLKFQTIPDEDHATVLHHAIAEGLRLTFPPRYK
ncbi:MAG TPA: alpha/beta hydrolase-fold protein [Flavobacteriales bacterium]